MKYVKRSDYTDRWIDSVSDSNKKCDEKNWIYRSRKFLFNLQEFDILPSHMLAGSTLLFRVWVSDWSVFLGYASVIFLAFWSWLCYSLDWITQASRFYFLYPTSIHMLSDLKPLPLQAQSVRQLSQRKREKDTRLKAPQPSEPLLPMLLLSLESPHLFAWQARKSGSMQFKQRLHDPRLTIPRRASIVNSLVL